MNKARTDNHGISHCEESPGPFRDIARKIEARFKVLTARRLWNRGRIKYDAFLRKSRVSSYPVAVMLEPCNLCNLKCPLCPTGQRLPVERGTMNMETFTRIIDQLHPYAWHLNLYYLGEPLLCEHLHEMIDYAHQRRMRVATSSNLNILNEKKAEGLIESGLDMLVVSLDGASPEVYEKYRIGGDFYRVLHNIQLLIKMKKDLRSPTPKILLQFVVFKHNEADIPNIQKLAERLGLELFLRQGALGGEGHSPPLTRNVKLAKQWLSQNKAYRKQYDQFSEKPYLSEGACPYLWNMLTVNWDGSVFPCCWGYDKEHIFGNILDQPFEEIWNNECFQSSRLLFSRRYSSFLKSRSRFQETICSRCKMYGHFLNT